MKYKKCILDQHWAIWAIREGGARLCLDASDPLFLKVRQNWEYTIFDPYCGQIDIDLSETDIKIY